MAEVEARAAHNVLEACAQTETVERVVYTSSVTAVVWRESRRLVTDLDERDWSDPLFCRKFRVRLNKHFAVADCNRVIHFYFYITFKLIDPRFNF